MFVLLALSVIYVKTGNLPWTASLAKTTPGPLIIVVAFVGFMAGFNHFHGSLWMGTLGLLATTFYTFLPCFLFVFAGAPLVGKINEFCAGIDVGKRFLLCCALTGAAQEEPRSQTLRFDATVQDLVHLRDWLSSKNITHVVMESTGSYWVPIFCESPMHVSRCCKTG
jgi:hypothetical protein